MGWAEPHNKPKPVTRADMCRELAAALGEDIPMDMTAEAAWPLMIDKVRKRSQYIKEHLRGSN